MNEFDDAYSAVEDYFGGRPEPVLANHLAQMNEGLPALDIGCGQGRNTFFLAENGFAVDALDPSPVAVAQVSRAAEERGLPVRAIEGTFQSIQTTEGRYGAVLVFGLIPLLDRTEIGSLIKMSARCLAPAGLLFVTAFGTWDPDYPRIASGWRKVGAESFRGPGGDLRTYLEHGELRRLFSGFEAIHEWEGLGPEHRHGSGPPERHGVAEAVLRR